MYSSFLQVMILHGTFYFDLKHKLQKKQIALQNRRHIFSDTNTVRGTQRPFLGKMHYFTPINENIGY